MPRGIYQRTPKSLADRFADKWVLNQSNGCWEWTAYLTPNGYGHIAMGGRSEPRWLAHRASWLLHKGEDPGALEVCHRCDNPRCVNPDHLFIGTQGDNMEDAKGKGRTSAPPKHIGEAHPQSRLTDADVKLIRDSSVSARSLAEALGVSKTAINYVRNNKTWRHV